MQFTTKAFTKVETYPIDLARLIGVEESALLYSLIRFHWKQSFFKSTAGWIWKDSCFDKLINLELIIYHEIAKSYHINYEKLEEILTPKEFKLPTAIPTFTDNKFITKCDEWHRILKDKNRSKTRKEIYSLFEGKTLEQSLEVLQYAIDNKHVTLFFNEKHLGDNKRAGDTGRVRSGGSKNTGEAGDKDHLARRPE